MAVTPTLDFNLSGFALAAVPVTDGSAYVLVATFTVPQRIRGKAMVLRGDVGAGDALTALKLTWAAAAGGAHADVLAGTAFNTASGILPFCTANPHTTAANGSFLMILDMLPPEFAIYAKKATTNTTLTLSGTVLGRVGS